MEQVVGQAIEDATIDLPESASNGECPYDFYYNYKMVYLSACDWLEVSGWHSNILFLFSCWTVPRDSMDAYQLTCHSEATRPEDVYLLHECILF